MINIKISQWSIITKLIVMNLFIFITVSGVVIVNFLLSKQVGATLVRVIDKDVKEIVDNAKLSRNLNNIFSDIHLLTYTFINDEEILKNEGGRLLKELQNCIDESVESKLIYNDLKDFKIDLERLIKQYSLIINISYDIDTSESQILNLINTLDEIVTNSIIKKKLEKKDYELYSLEQLSASIPDYRNLLFQIKINIVNLKDFQLNIKQNNIDYKKIIFNHLNELIANLGLIKATEKELEPLGNKIINTALKYKQQIKHLNETIYEFQELSETLNIKKIAAINKLQRFDNEISYATNKIGKDIMQNIQTTNNITFILSVIILIILISIQIYGIRLTKPIQNLTNSASEIASGNLDTPINTSGKDELGILARSFIKMRNSIKEKIKALAEKNIKLEEEIFERKKSDKDRERLNSELTIKNKELEQLIYVTSHDLRSPLVNIDGFSKELLLSINKLNHNLEKLDIPESNKKDISFIMDDDISVSMNYILKSVHKMDQLLNGLLQLSRLGRTTLTVSEIDMNTLIYDILHTFDYSIKKNKIKIELDNLPPCKGDFLQVNQLFSNLIDNAIKYLDSKRDGVINISGTRKRKFIEYIIKDNGIGISQNNKEKIFELFYRLDPKKTSGEGLGLSIIKKIVIMHKGKISIESEPDKGSRFIILLHA